MCPDGLRVGCGIWPSYNRRRRCDFDFVGGAAAAAASISLHGWGGGRGGARVKNLVRQKDRGAAGAEASAEGTRMETP